MAAQQHINIMSEQIIGRERELAILNQLYKSNRAEFIAIYGRRRVGKTFLIRNFFANKAQSTFFYTAGVYGQSMSTQITEFVTQITKTFYQKLSLQTCNNWLAAFELLWNSIVQQVPKKSKMVIFIDELPWMATHRSKLLQALDYYWNRYFSTDNRIKLIICGSATSWIIHNIVNNKSGLHNRLTHTIQLEPFNLAETKKYLHSTGIKLNINHITHIYMAIGGIPYYLAQIKKCNSATQIIDQLAFTKNSFLMQEFNNLYAALFANPAVYIELIRIIASKRYGISQEQLFGAIKLSSKGGTITKKLRELEDTGFIISFTPYNSKQKGIYYKLIDEYTLFYLKWIEPLKNTLSKQSLRKGYWQQLQNTAKWYSWAGLSFEALCYKHITQISKSLNLAPTALPSTWRYSPRKSSNVSGAQIDLLFDRDDDTITICEIKFTNEPFTINKVYATTLRNKITTFKKVTRTKKQILLAMISANGLQQNSYSDDMVQGVITLQDLI